MTAPAVPPPLVRPVLAALVAQADPRRTHLVLVRSERPLDVLVGVGFVGVTAARHAVHLAGRLARPLVRTVAAVPVPSRLQPKGLTIRLADRGHAERVILTDETERALRATIPVLLEGVLDQVDLTDLLIGRVDFERVVAAIDVTALVERVDIKALVSQVLDEIDVPELVRACSGSVASDTVENVRIHSIEADQRVNRLVDRLLRRTTGERPMAPPVPATETP